MLPEAISDQKRLVRGLQWKRARYFLRARDGVHHRPWRLLTVAGPVPHEEVACIRELMPRAVITAVDIDQNNLLAAIDAGVDDALHCDLSAYQQLGPVNAWTPIRHMPPASLYDLQKEEVEKFDVICLDLTGPASEWLRRLVRVYFTEMLAAKGTLIVTFSYGRDVVEILHMEWEREWQLFVPPKYSRHHLHSIECLSEIPDQIAARVWFTLRGLSKHLDSCIQYRGNRMPMISCLLWKRGGRAEPARFIVVEPDDYRHAISAEDVGAVFACPVERIEQLRKKHVQREAGRKAAETRARRKLKVAPQLRLITQRSEPDAV